MKSLLFLRPFLVLAALFFFALDARAHKLQVEPVVVIVRPQRTFLTVEMKGNGEDIIQAVVVRDSERLGSTQEDFVPAVSTRLQNYINARLQFSQGQQKLTGRLELLEYRRPDPLDYTTSRFRVLLRYARPEGVAQQSFQVRSTLFDYLPNARTIVSLSGLSKSLIAGKSAEFDPSQVTANVWRNARDFAVLGIEHIFTGPDHVLFILALLLVSSSFWPLVKTLSGFTLAHSLTFGVGGFGNAHAARTRN